MKITFCILILLGMRSGFAEINFFFLSMLITSQIGENSTSYQFSDYTSPMKMCSNPDVSSRPFAREYRTNHSWAIHFRNVAGSLAYGCPEFASAFHSLIRPLSSVQGLRKRQRRRSFLFIRPASAVARQWSTTYFLFANTMDIPIVYFAVLSGRTVFERTFLVQKFVEFLPDGRFENGVEKTASFCLFGVRFFFGITRISVVIVGQSDEFFKCHFVEYRRVNALKQSEIHPILIPFDEHQRSCT